MPCAPNLKNTPVRWKHFNNRVSTNVTHPTMEDCAKLYERETKPARIDPRSRAYHHDCLGLKA